MAFEIRGRRVAYDNIAVAQATGRERTTGATPSTECLGGGTGSSTDPGGGTSGVDAKNFSNLVVGSTNNTSDPYDNQQVGVVTMSGENVKVGG